MIVLELIAALAAGILLMGVWFGLEAAATNALQKFKMHFLMPFRHLFSALIPTAAILMLSGHYYLHVSSIANWQYWLGSMAIAFAAAAIVSLPTAPKTVNQNLMTKVLDGILMEIPMRLMMQAFVWYILKLMNISSAVSAGIVINSLIWGSGIIIQNVLSKGKWNSKIWKELTASLVFSLGAGFLLSVSDFILFPMIAHALEKLFASFWSMFALNNMHKQQINL